VPVTGAVIGCGGEERLMRRQNALSEAVSPRKIDEQAPRFLQMVRTGIKFATSPSIAAVAFARLAPAATA